MPQSFAPIRSFLRRQDWGTLYVFSAILLFFLISGTCGLLYQVVWTRKLVLLFGTASYAVSTVLSIFFLGLGLGSLWGGRLADGSKRPLFLYGIMEIAIGMWAILFILFIDTGEAATVSILSAVDSSRTLSIAARGLLAGVFLLLPVTLMGATLPLLSKCVTRGNRVRGMPISALYSLNTFGAMAGCAGTGFILIARFGYTRTTFIGAALNVLVGILAMGLSRKTTIAAPPSPTASTSKTPGVAGMAQSPRVARLVVLAFAVSGFCSIALEVLWTRLLAIVFSGTTYAFTTMLATILCGIALGSTVAAAFIDRIKRPVLFFGLTQGLTAASCLFMLHSFPFLPERLAEFQKTAGYDWNELVLWKFLLCFAVLFPPTFFFGMSFPAAVRAYTGPLQNVGRDVGKLYTANTFGGVAGALAGGFLILPMLGAHWGIVLLSLLLGAMGWILAVACPTPRDAFTALYAVAIPASIALLLAILPGDVSLAMNHWFLPDDHEMIHHSEGTEGTVVVSSPKDGANGTGRYLWINAVQATASIDKGLKMNRFQGVLPFLFDRDPRRALFMCFGSGVTAGTLALSPFERIDAVEISEDVLEAAPLFEADNFAVIDNPKLRFIIDDGRNYLLTSKEHYDLISFEPMPLALAGVSTFYTREYYELCRKRLARRGMVSQWVPIHSLNMEIVRSMVATFVSVFPECTAWFINSDLFLIGSEEPLSIDYRLIEQRLEDTPELLAGLEEVYLGDVPELLASFIMGKKKLAGLSAGTPIMTDDRPWAEFAAPKLIYSADVAEALEELGPYRENALPLLAPSTDPDLIEVIERRATAHSRDFEALKAYYGGMILSNPEEGFLESLEIDPGDLNAKYYLSQIYYQKGLAHVGWEDYEEAEDSFAKALEHSPNRLDALLGMADAYQAWQKPEDASAFYRLYLKQGGAATRARDRATQKSAP